MLSEEEKEAIEQLRSWRKYIIEHRESVNKANDIEFYLRTALNLIEKQQKELSNLKEIEQLHQEENGKLRVELEQEKEKNKELEHEILKRQWVKVDENGNIEPVFYISKDKIREIVIPTPDNPIPLEIQQSEFYAKILKVLEGKNDNKI